ncbi:MAG: hypothetical protein BWZ02_02622 [Lentisphaerae bacterium ADurb.BinA184]|nr:MAG: hypothetical protein BWZ02_02622 [Lentisphaerae bacterium ADurb.BinA184]
MPRPLARLALALGLVAVLPAVAGAAAERVPAEPAGRTVYVLPVHGPIDKAMMILFRRAFRDVKALAPDAVVLDIDTPGGGLTETEEILRWLGASKAPVYAYVNPNAISAGAILCFGCDRIFMAPGGRIGSALPIVLSPTGDGVVSLPENVEEKILSNTRSLVRSLAQSNGHRVDVAEAMVDPAKEVVIGSRTVCRSGEILNLTAREAIEIIPPETRPLLAEAIVDDVGALLEHAGAGGARQVRFAPQPAEKLARYIVLAGPLLFALAVLALYIEFKTPGFGAPGIAGIVLLMVFFFGHYVAGLAGVEDIALVLVGLLLLGLEVFVIPGFGVVGIAGIVLIVAGTVLSMIPYLPQAVPALPALPFGRSLFAAHLEAALIRLVIAVLLSGAGVWLAVRLLPHTSIYSRLVLGAELTRESGCVAAADHAGFLGQEGMALTVLRPAGTAVFGERRLDVVSSGDLIPKDARVRVVRVEGGRIVVERC